MKNRVDLGNQAVTSGLFLTEWAENFSDWAQDVGLCTFQFSAHSVDPNWSYVEKTTEPLCGLQNLRFCSVLFSVSRIPCFSSTGRVEIQVRSVQVEVQVE